jgi:hypothetical protein
MLRFYKRHGYVIPEDVGVVLDVFASQNELLMNETENITSVDIIQQNPRKQ